VSQTVFDVDPVGSKEELNGVGALAGLAAMPRSMEIRFSTCSGGRRKQATRVGEELCSEWVDVFARASPLVL